MPILSENKAQCIACGDIIISEVEGVFKPCSCGKIKIAGGKKDAIRLLLKEPRFPFSEYIPAVAGRDYIEMSTYLLNE